HRDRGDPHPGCAELPARRTARPLILRPPADTGIPAGAPFSASGLRGQHAEGARTVVEPFAAVRGEHHDVLDARTPLAREVHARLDAEGHALAEHEVVAGHDVGLLVYRQSDAVPGAVHEGLRE